MDESSVISPGDVIKTWERYFNERDAERLADLYHPEATNLQIAVGHVLEGRAAILDDFRQFFANIPDNTTHILNVIESNDWISIEWEGGGTFAPTGQAFTFRGAGFFQIHDGLIKVQRGYWDMLDWCRVTGLPISEPS